MNKTTNKLQHQDLVVGNYYTMVNSKFIVNNGLRVKLLMIRGVDDYIVQPDADPLHTPTQSIAKNVKLKHLSTSISHLN